MEDIFEQFPDQETFDKYWNANYNAISYDDVKEEFEKFVEEAEKQIFTKDYEEAGVISKDTFKENLAQTAQFTFQDTLTEVFYEKNPDLYETAFALFEEAQMNGQGDQNVAMTFHKEYNRLYDEFLDQMFENLFA